MDFKMSRQVEVSRREGSWYDYTRTYRKGILYQALYKGDPNHESSYTIFNMVVRYGDGFLVKLPRPF
jgi:hypothetical protein